MKTLPSYRNLIGLLVAAVVLLSTLGLTSAVSADSVCGSTYTVQRGDYLTKIARTCGVSYSDLLKANPQIIFPSLIYPGQVINVPSSTIPVTGGKPGTYTVKAGDTLTSISQRFGRSVAELRLANPNLGSAISTGQVLNIPGRVQFAAGGTAAAYQDSLGANSKHYYLLRASAGQTLEATISSQTGITMTILGADGSPIQSAGANITFRGGLPKTQDYLIVLASGSAGSYNLSVDIPARISFAAGGTSATLTSTVPDDLGQYYILRASKGQTLNVTVSPQVAVRFVIYGVDGDVLRSGMGEDGSFSGTLPKTQDYILGLTSRGGAQAFTLKVNIPAGGSTEPGTSTKSYTVQRGDTLFRIAWRFNTTVSALMRANPQIINPNFIAVGDVIYLPGATITLSNGKVIYVAASGDSMSSIARKFNTTLSALINANSQIGNPNLIYTGQRINIP